MRNPSIIIGLIMLALIVLVALGRSRGRQSSCSSPASVRACAAATAPTNWIRHNTQSAPTAMAATG